MEPENEPLVNITMIDNIIGKKLKFVDAANDDYRLLPGSSCVDNAAPLNPDVVLDHSLLYQYVKHSAIEARPNSAARPEDKALGIGAYELPVGEALDRYLQELNMK